MTSTELKIGLTNSARPSSRVLKPPGGGHSNIFAEPELAVNAPRPKYNQQNSSNLNACMGSTDANIIVEKLREEITQTKQHQPQPQQQETTAESPKTEEAPPQQSAVKSHDKESANNITNGGSGAGDGGDQSSRGRVPPGGFSSGGFW